jgi:hypothetical protein
VPQAIPEIARKLRDLEGKIARQEAKLGGKDFAGVRASLDPQEPPVAERIGGSMRPDGDDALRFDLPLPAGFQVSGLEISPEGLAFKVRGLLPAPALLPASPMLATAAAPPSPAFQWAPVRLESPVAGMPGYAQPIGNIWSLRTA